MRKPAGALDVGGALLIGAGAWASLPCTRKRLPAEAGLRWLWRVHGSLNFVRKAIKVLVQSVVHLELGLVRCQVADQGGVSCILAEFFD